MASKNGATTDTPTVYRATIKQLAELHSVPQATLRAALKTHPVFQEVGAVEEREIEGSDYPAMKWIAISAFDKWVKARSDGERSYTPRSGGARYVVHMTAEQAAQVNEMLSPLGLVAEKLSSKRKEKTADAGANGTAAAPINEPASETSDAAFDLVSA